MEVNIKDEYVEKIKQRIAQDEEFSTVDDYVNNILSQVVERLENEKLNEDTPELSKEDEEKVKERLKSLGYLD